MEKSHTQIIEEHVKCLLLATRREGVEELYHAMCDNGFFQASCQFHHNFEGGTAWYSMEAALRIVKNNRYTLLIDSMIIVALLHELYCIDGGDDSTLSGSRSLATLSRICPHFKLKQSEYEAILWCNYTSQQLKYMGDQAQVALTNPLRQALHSSKLYCIKHPKNWEELEAAMTGGRYSRRDVIVINNRSHGFAYQRQRPKEKSYYNGIQSTDQAPKQPRKKSSASKLSNISIVDLALELQRRAKEEDLTKEEIKYIREIQDALPVVHYKIYKNKVDEAIMDEMDALIDRACNKRRNGVIDIVALIYDRKNKDIFDTNMSYMDIYRALVEKFGPLHFKDDTFKHKCGFYLGKKFRQNKTY